MGLFDNLRCEMPLPVEWEQPRDLWQTKDLDCDMTTYTITSDGRLLRAAGGWGNGDVQEMEIPYHGDIRFYDLDDARGWLSLVARFTEGRCVRIWVSEWSPPRGKPDAKPPAGWGPAQAEGGERG